MTTTSGPPCARTNPTAEFSSAAGAALHIGGDCLQDGPVGKVGLEIEAHCFDLRRPDAPPEVGRAHRRHRAGARTARRQRDHRRTRWRGRDSPGRRPTGRCAAIAAMRADRDGAARRVRRRRAWAWSCSAPTRCGPPHGSTPAPATARWSEFFAASGTAAAGAAMMTSTASVQVNVDAGPARRLGRPGASRARARPDDDRHLRQLASARRRVHRLAVSTASGSGASSTHARCGPVLGATATTIRPTTGRATRCGPRSCWCTTRPTCGAAGHRLGAVRRLGRRAAVLGGRRPTEADLDYHLTTLFPPVRPRGFLEIRYLDSVPDAVWPAVVFTIVDAARRSGRRRRRRRGHRVGRHGVGPCRAGRSRRPPAARRRGALRRAAAERAPAELARLRWRVLLRPVEQGRSPADDFSDRVVRARHRPGGAVDSRRRVLSLTTRHSRRD